MSKADHLRKPRPKWNRRRNWVLLLTFLILGPYLFSRYAATSRLVQLFADPKVDQALKDSKELSILIFNIAHGRGPVSSNLSEGGDAKKKRIEEIANFLKNENADIVILNEVDFFSSWSGHQNQAAAIAKLAGYPFRGEQRNLDFRFLYGSWQFGNAILSKYRIGEYRLIDYPALNRWEPLLVGKNAGHSLLLKFQRTFQLTLCRFTWSIEAKKHALIRYRQF